MWEYKWLDLERDNDKAEAQLNELGSQGWEAVSVVAQPPGPKLEWKAKGWARRVLLKRFRAETVAA